MKARHWFVGVPRLFGGCHTGAKQCGREQYRGDDPSSSIMVVWKNSRLRHGG
jgi:hypothetical protein